MRRKVSVLVTASAVAAAVWFTATASSADDEPRDGAVLGVGVAGALPGRFIVVFKEGTAAAGSGAASASRFAGRVGGRVDRQFTRAVRGFSASLTEAGARQLASDPSVAFVEQDRQVALDGTQTNPVWGLDRIDQRDLPLSRSYTYGAAGNVTAYILDTGVRLSHPEFGGRARSGYDFIDNDTDASDCQGHGTHVAGTVGGSTYGVAKDVRLVSVRVLDCGGSGAYSQIIAGIDWVVGNASRPSVANMSLGGSAGAALDSAVRNATAAGVSFAVSAGNENTDACTKSPARVAEAITVGATSSSDARASFSNFGTCVDLFAPGVGIVSSANGGGTTSMSGTSMSSPHVAGAAALYLGANPGASARQVHDALIAAATAGKVTGAGAGSPNRLLFTTAGTTPPVTPPPSPTPSVTPSVTPSPSASVTPSPRPSTTRSVTPSPCTSRIRWDWRCGYTPAPTPSYCSYQCWPRPTTTWGPSTRPSWPSRTPAA
ncbi:MAG TPA: S8 family peptidase [Micromonosporaceae bacterium]|nr:S8 family peptidase [Micromonosporaceae bacterium]